MRATVLYSAPLFLYLAASAASMGGALLYGVPGEGERTLVLSTREGLPAARAGLRAGDEIKAVDGRPIRALEEVSVALNAGGATAKLDLVRDHEPLTITVEPVIQDRIHRIGVELETVPNRVTPSVGGALWLGLQFPVRHLATVLPLFLGSESAEFSGPVGIVRVARKAPVLPAVLSLVARGCSWLALLSLLLVAGSVVKRRLNQS